MNNSESNFKEVVVNDSIAFVPTTIIESNGIHEGGVGGFIQSTKDINTIFYYLKFNLSKSLGNYKWLSITEDCYKDMKHYLTRYDEESKHQVVVSNRELNEEGYFINGLSDKLPSRVETNPYVNTIKVPLNVNSKSTESPIEESDIEFITRMKDSLNTIVINEKYYLDNPSELQLLLKSLTIKKLK